jgi:cell wall-associated NlpC family hydrolase
MTAAGALAMVGVSQLVAPAHASSDARGVHVTGLSVHSEPTWGGDWITVHGSGFAQKGKHAVTAVWFGSHRASETEVIDDHTISAEDPEIANHHKTVRVRVKLRNGHESKSTKAGRFTFTVPTMSTPVHDGLSTKQSQALATTVIDKVEGTSPPTLAPRSSSWTSAAGRSAVALAERWVGMPYTWGGGNASGPTLGSPYGDGLLGHFDAKLQGFDCSGLVLYAWAPYKTLPHYSASQHDVAGHFHPTRDELQPGDLIFFSGGGSTIDHVVMYVGDGKVVQAPESGYQVEVVTLAHVRAAEARYLGATRPASKKRGASPRITSMSSRQGTTAGGQTITIHGSHLATTSRLRFGSVVTYHFTVVSSTEVQVVVPASAAGTVSVRLGNAWGLSKKTSADRFTYAPPTGPTPSPSPTPSTTPSTRRAADTPYTS